MELQAQKRERFGKETKALRGEGLVPAELYGKGVQNEHLSIDSKELKKALKGGESTVIQLMLGKDKRMVLIHDLQRDSVSGEIAHVDFYQVKMDEKTTAKVSLEFVGESPAVKEGGILNRSMTEVEVEALPADLPPSIEVDISQLAELDQSIYVKDIKAPKGVEILVDLETVVASVTPPLAEEPVEAPAIDVSEVKVETEEKKAERESVEEEEK